MTPDKSVSFFCKVYYADEFRKLRERIFPSGEDRWVELLIVYMSTFLKVKMLHVLCLLFVLIYAGIFVRWLAVSSMKLKVESHDRPSAKLQVGVSKADAFLETNREL